jgi:hypothetical protein
MKKDDALSKLDEAGNKINSLYGSAWNTALNPTRYGWGSSLIGVLSIAPLSFASIGHLVGSSVVRQVPDETFEKITTLGAGDRPKKSE